MDPCDDFLTTRGTIEPNVTLAVYDPKDDRWGTPLAIRGSHGVERTTGGRAEGDTATTETTWWITSITGTAPTFSRPLLNSKIAACGKTWLILDVSPNPRNGRLFECFTQLSPGG